MSFNFNQGSNPPAGQTGFQFGGGGDAPKQGFGASGFNLGTNAPKPAATGFTLGGTATSAPAASGFAFGGTTTVSGTATSGFSLPAASAAPSTGFSLSGSTQPAVTGFGLAPTTSTPALTGFGFSSTPATTSAPAAFNLGGGTTAPAASTAFSSGSMSGGTTTPAATGFNLGIITTTTAPTGFSALGTTTTSAPAAFSLGTATTTTSSTGFNLGGTAASTQATGFSLGGPPPKIASTAFSLGTATSSTPAIGSTATAPTTAVPTTATPAPSFSFPTTSTGTTAGVSLATSSTGLNFGLSSLSSGTTTAPTSTTTTASSNAISSLNFVQLEETINKWTLDLEEQEKLFMNQATQVNAWDHVLTANGEKIVTLNAAVEAVKVEQQQLDHELDFILAQQRELEDCLVPLEKELAGTAVTDPEREHTYELAESMDTQLKQMSEDLKEIIEHLNENNRAQDSSDPLVQLGRILNAHMNSLQWIDQNTQVIQNRLDQVTKLHDSHRRDNERSFHLSYD